MRYPQINEKNSLECQIGLLTTFDLSYLDFSRLTVLHDLPSLWYFVNTTLLLTPPLHLRLHNTFQLQTGVENFTRLSLMQL